MLADRLTRHVEASAEIAQRLYVLGTQSIEQPSSTRVGQRFEHSIHNDNMQPFGCLSTLFSEPVPLRGVDGHMPAKASKLQNGPRARKSHGGARGITAEEIKDVEELATPRTPVIYEVVRRLGEEEMQRPLTSLWWFGNIIGGTALFTLIAYAQVMEEI